MTNGAWTNDEFNGGEVSVGVGGVGRDEFEGLIMGHYKELATRNSELVTGT